MLMPKKLRIIATTVAVFAFAAGVAFAQDTQTSEEFTFEKAYQDYVYTLDQYQGAHGEYKLARAQYLQAKTLVAQTNAREATAKMLVERDNVVITYLTALRLKLAETEGVNEIERENIYLLVDAEVKWFTAHRDKITSAGTLDDLVADSDAAKSQFTAFTTSVIYQSLSELPIAKVSLMREDAIGILSSIKTKVEEVRTNGDWDSQIPVIDRWVTETDNKITRSLDKSIEAQTSIPNLNVTNNNYTAVVTKAQEAAQLLRDASGFMREIIRNLKST